MNKDLARENTIQVLKNKYHWWIDKDDEVLKNAFNKADRFFENLENISISYDIQRIRLLTSLVVFKELVIAEYVIHIENFEFIDEIYHDVYWNFRNQ